MGIVGEKPDIEFETRFEPIMGREIEANIAELTITINCKRRVASRKENISGMFDLIYTLIKK